MRRLSLLVGTLVSIAAVTLSLSCNSDSSATNAAATRYCKVNFGNPNIENTDTVQTIFARTADSLLIYRSGDLESEPEIYPMAEDRLETETLIPPFKAGDTTYVITSLNEYTDEEQEGKPRHSLMLNVRCEDDNLQLGQFGQYCDVRLLPDKSNMEVAHFDGPMSIEIQKMSWKLLPGTQFTIGGDPLDVRTNVGTIDENAGCWTVTESGEDKFADGVFPTVTVEFPTTDPDSPVVESFPLDQFC